MRIVFFGSSEFAVPILMALKDKEEVVLIVTQPDRKKGRALKVGCTPVKNLASKWDIEIFQPDNVNSYESIQYLKRFDADVFIVVSFGQILCKGLLDIPSRFPLNLHASLLPKYRGAAPINWAIANGEEKTGVTIIKMNEKMDRGDIILKEEVSIGKNEDAIELSRHLSDKGAEVLLNCITLIKKNALPFMRQDNFEVSCAPKLKKEDGLIDWDSSNIEICNRIRAFVPWPGCWTYWNKKMLKIWKARPYSIIGTGMAVPYKYKPIKERHGTVIDVNKNGILVSTGQGGIKIEELQLEDRRRMKVEEFIAGHRKMATGTIFSLQK